jgi:hypothetical protein
LIFTVFESLPTNDKVPISPTGDKTFTFVNVEASLEQCHDIFNNYFALSRPLTKSVKCTRDSASLEQYYSMTNGYVVIDFDKVTDKKAIIEYFKNNNYSTNIFKSRNNIKAVIEVDFPTNRANVEALLNKLNKDLNGLCEVDISSARNASYQAPSFKEGKLYYNVGVKPTIDDIKSYIQVIQNNREYTDINVQWFWDKFIIKYGMQPKAHYNSNGTIQCSLPSEEKTKFSYYWDQKIPWLLQHPNKQKTLNIFNDFLRSDEGKLYIKNKNIEKFKQYFESLKHNISINERYFSVTQPIEELIRTCLSTKNSVLFIKGVMGSGKSVVIDHLKRPRTLYIAMRRSLSYDIKDKYKCKHYIDDLNNMNKNRYRPGDSIVVQVDSIHKIDINNFDLVVIDEFESFCLHTQSNMLHSDYYVSNMRIIKNIFETKNMVVADAFLNDLTRQLYFKNKKFFCVENAYRDTATVYRYEHKSTFTSMIEQVASTKLENEVITCSFGTLNEMKTIKKILESKGLKVISIDSNITDEARSLAAEMFKDNINNRCDVILYSPTITVGISILNNVKHHFHYDTGKSIDPVSSIQMTKRSRTAEFVHIYIDGKRNLMKSYDPEALNEETLKNIKSISKTNQMMFNYDTDDVSSLGKFVNCFNAHTNFYINNHMETFLYLLHQQFSNVIEVNEVILNKNYDKIHKETLKDNKINYVRVTRALDLEDRDLDYFKKKLSEEELSYQKCLELKDELYMLSDDTIKDVFWYSTKHKQVLSSIKNMIFFTKNTKSDMKTKIDNLVMASLRNTLISTDEIKDYKILYESSSFDLYDVYTKAEVIKMNLTTVNFTAVVKALGYRYRNGGYYLPKLLKRVLNEASNSR